MNMHRHPLGGGLQPQGIPKPHALVRNDLREPNPSLGRSRGRGSRLQEPGAGGVPGHPHLGAGRRGRAARLGLRCCPMPSEHQPGAGTAQSRSLARALLPLLLTCSAFLIEANGSATWGETSFFLSYGAFKLKKKIPKPQPRAPWCSRENHTPPPAASTLIASPQRAAVGAENQSQPERSAQADKDFTPAQPEPGWARRAVTRKWHFRNGVPHLLSSGGFFYGTRQRSSPTLSPRLSQEPCLIILQKASPTSFVPDQRAPGPTLP